MNRLGYIHDQYLDPDRYYASAEPVCDICGGSAEAWGEPQYNGCMCPECPVCDEVGNPACYDQHSDHYHGLERSLTQMASLAKAQAYWAKEAEDMVAGELQRQEDDRLAAEYYQSLRDSDIGEL
jgi:hypothetical protein